MNNDMTVEEALKRLEQINAALESGKPTLDEAIQLYKEGVELSAMCKKKLDNAKMQIKVLDGSGNEQDIDYEPDDILCALVPNDNALTSEVSKAAVYSLSGGGKRLRPVLMMKFFELCGGKKSDNFLDIFCTIELVHTFSLIHDDLPCMDNDDYRRGRLPKPLRSLQAML